MCPSASCSSFTGIPTPFETDMVVMRRKASPSLTRALSLSLLLSSLSLFSIFSFLVLRGTSSIKLCLEAQFIWRFFLFFLWKDKNGCHNAFSTGGPRSSRRSLKETEKSVLPSFSMKPKKMKMKGGNLEKNNVKDAKTPEPSFLREQKRERERERERKRKREWVRDRFSALSLSF